MHMLHTAQEKIKLSTDITTAPIIVITTWGVLSLDIENSSKLNIFFNHSLICAAFLHGIVTINFVYV